MGTDTGAGRGTRFTWSTPAHGRNALVSDKRPNPAERVAATSDDFYSTILTSVSDTVLITNDIGDFHYICPNIHTIFGYTALEIANLGNISRLWDIDLLKHYPPGSFQEISNIELVTNDKYGVSHILLVNIKAVSIFGGTVLFTCRDITKRKQAEMISQQESAKAQQYLDIAEVVMVFIDKDEKIALINQKGCKVLGVTESELVGKSWIQTFIPTELRISTTELFNALMMGNLESYEYYENDLIVGSGERRRFAWHTALCHDLSGGITGILSSGEDITERRKAEQALRHQSEEIQRQAARIEAINHQLQSQLDENRRTEQALAENRAALETLINSVSDSIFAVDRELRLTSFNTVFQTGIQGRFGTSIQKGMPLFDMMPEIIIERWFPRLEQALKGESVIFSFHQDIPEAAIDIYNEASLKPMLSASGEVTGVAICVRDITESKHAELTLRRSEVRFRSVVENVPLAFHIYDFQQADIVYANPLFEWMFRYVTTKDKVDLPTWYEHVCAEDRPPMYALLESGGTKIPEEREFRVVFPSGTMRYLRQLNFPIIETDNVIRQMASFIEDISERKQIERALRQNERLLDRVINHALYGIAALSSMRNSSGMIVDFEFRLVNQGVAQQLQASPIGMIGRRLSDEIPEAMQDGLFARYVEVVEGGQILDIEYSRGEAPLQQHFRITGVKLDDGLVATYVDITERKKNQDALVQNRALLESILTNLPSGVMVTSIEGKVLSVNDRYAERLQHRPDELLDHNIGEFFLKDDLAIWNRDNAIVLQTGQPTQSEVQEMIGDIRHTLLVDHFPLSDGQGSIFGTGRIAVDITEQKQIQDQLRDLSRQIVEVQEKERRHVARELHDEVGQSLTGILLLLNKVKQTSSDQDGITIDEIQTLIRQLMTQIRELSHNLHPPILDNHGLLDALRWYCKHYSGQTQIQVTFTYTGSHGRLRPEIELTCYRVIQEALTNIARYAQVDTATVGVSVSSSEVKLSIEDKGVGFDPATVRAHDATFGLLGMSERIALLRGKIDIVSAPGQGTRIAVEIPLGLMDMQS